MCDRCPSETDAKKIEWTSLIAFVASHPGVTSPEIARHFGKGSGRVCPSLWQLMTLGVLGRSGRGGSGDPYRWTQIADYSKRRPHKLWLSFCECGRQKMAVSKKCLACKLADQHAAAEKRRERTCEACGKKYINWRTNRNEGNRFCSRACGVAAKGWVTWRKLSVCRRCERRFRPTGRGFCEGCLNEREAEASVLRLHREQEKSRLKRERLDARAQAIEKMRCYRCGEPVGHRKRAIAKAFCSSCKIVVKRERERRKRPEHRRREKAGLKDQYIKRVIVKEMPMKISYSDIPRSLIEAKRDYLRIRKHLKDKGVL